MGGATTGVRAAIGLSLRQTAWHTCYLSASLPPRFPFAAGAIMDWISLSELSALAQVVVVDLVLAGDNAVVIGLAVAGLPREQRARAMVIGIAAATLLRILFASITVQLLQVIGLLLAGGLLLLWVSWQLDRKSVV